jgi:hypothetical protein
MSDWQQRPLTQRQREYAALDAFVLPQLYDALQQHLGPDATAKLIKQHTKVFHRVGGAAGGAAQLLRLVRAFAFTAALVAGLSSACHVAHAMLSGAIRSS